MRYWLLVSLLFLTSACTLLPPDSQLAHITPELMMKYQAHQQSLKQFQHWRAAGKIALISASQRQSSRMNWQHSPIQSQLILTNLLGVTLLEAEQQDQQARIQADGKTYTGKSLSQLIEQLTGYAMPIESMQQWLAGQSSDSKVTNLSLDEWGHLLAFEQDVAPWGRWQIRYNGYFPATETLPALPSTITLQHPTLTIKLVIHEWSR